MTEIPDCHIFKALPTVRFSTTLPPLSITNQPFHPTASLPWLFHPSTAQLQPTHYYKYNVNYNDSLTFILKFIYLLIDVSPSQSVHLSVCLFYSYSSRLTSKLTVQSKGWLYLWLCSCVCMCGNEFGRVCVCVLECMWLL